jgi:7,8-dihydro-6-hydroxymethylpterin-pyrophosphokinase
MYNQRESEYRQLKRRKRKKRKINLDIMAYPANLLTDLIVTVSSSDAHISLTK